MSDGRLAGSPIESAPGRTLIAGNILRKKVKLRGFAYSVLRTEYLVPILSTFISPSIQQVSQAIEH